MNGTPGRHGPSKDKDEFEIIVTLYTRSQSLRAVNLLTCVGSESHRLPTPHSHPHTGYATSCSTWGPVILALDQDIKAISRSRLAAGRTRSTQTVLVFFELKFSSKGNEGSGEPTDKHKLHGLRRPATSSCPGASRSVFSPPFRPKVQFCGKAGAPPSHVSLGWQE